MVEMVQKYFRTSRKVCVRSLMIEAYTNLTTMFLLFILISCCFGVASPSHCPLNEYRAGLECCPSCPPGMHVVKDCEERSITKCSWCPDGTFQAGFNEQKRCSNCTKCDAGLGLKVKKSCSSTSDAVCEVLDGFFCSDSNGGGCRAAQRHTVCSPGQYIGQRGTADKDTECLHCTDGTFSNGTSSSCQNYTKCESVGLKLMKPGTDSTDSECGEHGPHAGLVAGIISGVILVMALMALIIAIIHRKNKRVTAVLTCDCVYHFIESTPQSKIETQSKELSQDYRPTETKPLKSTDGPEPTRDQQEHTITIPETIDDHHGDRRLDPAPPSSPTHNGSVSLPVHPPQSGPKDKRGVNN
ncbi:tumor necrosis factor receptor superfamily member 14 isoform X7 [Gadus morhua]|uniref:tumor necrosis factor receptor superfamily member 14 isoform X7 n=1 Tax=Gadus morhua TaxID=8049 RepID=UPI0011B617C6|nr:tumor necrosis factor receptor superfamily member 14-like isoform X7 [Gadus morhua]